MTTQIEAVLAEIEAEHTAAWSVLDDVELAKHIPKLVAVLRKSLRYAAQHHSASSEKVFRRDIAQILSK